MSEENPHYFQFPLCLLDFGSDTFKRLDAILTYSYNDYGSKLWRNMPPAHRLTERGRIETHYSVELEGAAPTDAECCAFLGAEGLGVNIHDVHDAVSEYEHICNYVEGSAEEHGNSPQVRIRTDIFWDALKGRLPYREFSVLAAIYSCIGDSEYPVRITRETIQLRALGYHTEDMRHEEYQLSRMNCPEVRALTESQIRTTVDKLFVLKLFSRVNLQPRSRHTYYSNRMTNDELRDAVVRRKTYRAELKAEEASKNAAAAEEIKRIKAALENTDKPLKGPTQGPGAPTAPPASVAEVRDYFESLYEGGGAHAAAYFASRGWEHSEAPWKASSARWLLSHVGK